MGTHDVTVHIVIKYVGTKMSQCVFYTNIMNRYLQYCIVTDRRIKCCTLIIE